MPAPRSKTAPTSGSFKRPDTRIDPAKLDLVEYPAAVLRERAQPVEQVNDEVRAVILRMIEIMRQEEGIGLAAPQVGLSWRLFICDVPPGSPERANPAAAPGDPPSSTSGPRAFINPVISKPMGTPAPMDEGCLSLPDIRGEVLRPPIVTITALDAQGKPFTESASGLLARCMQHELDHLDGVLIIDRFTQMSRLKNKAAIRDLERG